MAHFLWKKLLALLLTLLAAATLIFAVLHLLPGNAAQVLLGPDADPQAVATLATQLGLDTPAWPRFTGWLRGLLHGDLGNALLTGKPAKDAQGNTIAVFAMPPNEAAVVLRVQEYSAVIATIN